MARVQVLSTPGCAGCERAKRMLAAVLDEIPELDWEEVDLIEQPEIAERYGVLSVPAIAIDGRLAFTSLPAEDALREAIDGLEERG